MADDHKNMSAYGDDEDEYKVGMSAGEEEDEFPLEDDDNVVSDYSDRLDDEKINVGPIDRIKDFFKNNIIYVIIVMVLIIPAGYQLKNMFASAPEAQEATYNVKLDKVYDGQKQAAPAAPGAPVAASTTQNPGIAAVPNSDGIANNNQITGLNPSTTNTSSGAMGTSTDTTSVNSPTEFALARNAKSLEDLDKQVTDLTQKLNDIEGKLTRLDALPAMQASLQATVTAIQANKTVETRVDDLSKQVQQLNTNTQDMVKSLYQTTLSRGAAPQSGMSAQGNSEQTDDFVVHATIPGRAWLRNRDGVLVTIREGEVLPGYGRVVKINPAKGTVTMDNNRVFREEPIS